MQRGVIALGLSCVYPSWQAVSLSLNSTALVSHGGAGLESQHVVDRKQGHEAMKAMLG